IQRIDTFHPQELVNTAWAFATLGKPAPQLFDAIARESKQRIGSFKPQELVNTAWAFATLGVLAPQLFDAIARASKKRIGNLKPQGLANIAWAFATLNVRAPEFFDAIAHASEQRIGTFNAQELANTAWAFAIVDTADRCALVKVLSARATEMGLAAFNGEQRRHLHQLFLSVELDANPPTELLAPIGLREACRQAMVEKKVHSSKMARPAKLHDDVSNELTRMGIAHVNEVCAPCLGYHVDIAILPKVGASALEREEWNKLVPAATFECARIAIEVDGPSHYDDERRLRPADEMMRRHLALAGWVVLGVPYCEWDALK
ncbi:hypothetical protein T492DRAFT_576900, partial [Pavlovales sp. CCMP2436]